MDAGPKTALFCYIAAALSIILGVIAAAARFPGGYDWTYTVISHLASPTRNPEGGRWVAGSLLAATAFLWPVTHTLARGGSVAERRPIVSVTVLRLGLIGAALLAVEGLTTLDLDAMGRKGHEAVAVLTFFSFYGGVLGLYVHRIRRTPAFFVPALVVVLPLVAFGLTQLTLYLGQETLGWVNPGWRDLGVPFWYSFAFWQWLAAAFLGIGLGVLVMADGAGAPDERGSSER